MLDEKLALSAQNQELRPTEAFRADVLEGLSHPQKSLPSRWLYDDRGSALFEDITRLEEYYPTRTETAILRRHIAEIADFCGERALVLEYGAGAGVKTEILLDALREPRLYVPIDIAGDFLSLTIERIRRRYPHLGTQPVIADFSQDFALPANLPEGPRAGFFPGSTIGNLDRRQAVAFLRRMRRHVHAGGAQTGGGAIIGVDLKKDLSTLLAAYDDSEGVTAAFNLNLLARINRELWGDFALDRFAHEARWNPGESAVEMHLVSLDDQKARVDGRTFSFRKGETIHTESSRKYSRESFTAMIEEAGWRVGRFWTDAAHRFGVFGLAA
jgi:dimethylhistidine N-methyltransferase